MPPVTRQGDKCTGHDCWPPRNSTSGSPNVFINGAAAHRLNDSGSCNCPHGGNYSSTSASATVFVNGMGLTRIGDETTCNSCGEKGSHVSGSENVFAG